MFNSLSKRLLSASRLGILFNYADGHRYLTIVDDGTELTGRFKEIIDHNNISIRGKIYGDIFEALEFIDYVLIKYNHPTLEEEFDKFQDWIDERHGIPCSNGPKVFEEHYIKQKCIHEWIESKVFYTCPLVYEYTCKICGETKEVEGEGIKINKGSYDG